MKIKVYILMSLSLLLWGCASMWNDANKLYQSKDYEGALTIYQDAEKKEPKGLEDPVNARQYKETRKEIANKYYREALDAAERGNLNEAIPLLKKAGELEPENMDVKDALQKLQSRKDENIKKADSLFNQGSSYLKEKNWRGAVKFFDDAIRLNKNLIAAYGKKQDAVKEQNQGDGLFSDGMERVNAGKVRDALPIFQQCKTQDPYHPKIDEVLKLTEEKIQSSKKSFEEAEKFRGMKNWSEAGKLYSKTLKLDSEYPDAASRQEEVVREEKAGQQLFDEGSSHFAGKKLTLALSLFKQCKEQSPYHSLVDNVLKDTEERLKRIAELHNEAEVSIKKQKHGNTIATLENLIDIYPYDEKATMSLVTTYITASKLFERNELYANMAITLDKAKDLINRFVYEDGGKSPNLSGLNEEITPRIDKAASKIYGRTRYELEVINRDKKGGASNEDLIGQSISSGFSNGKPSNLIFSSRSFSKLSGEELASYRKVNTPNKFIMFLEITSIETDETRNENPLSKEYISRYVTEDNPDYDVAVNSYNTEVDNYNAKMADYRKQKADIDNKAKDQGLLGLALSVTTTFLQPSRASLDNAKSKLENTPKTVKKPINDTHYYNEVTVTRKISIYANSNLMGKEFESQEDWQEDEAVSGQYFDKPKPDIGIKRISLNLPPNKELIETAIRRLGQKIQTKYSKLLKEHLVDGYIEKGKKDILDDALLNAYENYLNAVFIDPSLVMGKLGSREAKATSPMDIENIRLIDDRTRKEFKELHGDKAFVLPLDKLSAEKQ